MKRLVFAASLLLPATALAQSSPPAAPVAAPAPTDAAEVSPNTALGLSVGVTLAGVGLVGLGWNALDSAASTGPVPEVLLGAGVAAVGLGPTVGHWYAGRVMTRGLATRLAGTAAVLGGAALLIADSACDDCERPDVSAGDLLMGLGVAAIVVGTVDDIVSAPGAARRTNAAQRRVTVTPTISPRQAGLAVAGTF
ncbi:MAG: hypothetical protein JNK64_18385 [Myxococcales bacterium]|nr:hypothetical protein [Myxococcales bacterium]